MSRSTLRLPRLLQRPEQGWSSLLLLLAMLILVGVSVADARLLELGSAGRSSSLVGLMLAAGLIGYLLARSSIGVVRAHILGAAIGAGLILLVAGSAAQDRSGLLPTSWQGFLETMALLYQRIQVEIRSVDQEAETVPMIVFLLFGALCWTTAQFSAFSIFRYDRGGPAVLAIGVVLFLNLYLASLRPDAELLPMLPQLALFAALAMLTMMRLQLTQQRERWARRHISDNGEVSRLFLRSGALFVAFSVAGASSLTLAATTGPHEFETAGLEDVLEDVGADLSRLLPILGIPRDPDQARSLGDGFDIPDAWKRPRGTAFTAVVDGDLGGNYWRMSAHDAFNGWAWSTTDGRTTSIGPDQDFDVTPGFGGTRWLGATITVDALEYPLTITSPAEPYLVVNTALQLTLIDANGGVGRIDHQNDEDADDPYQVEAFVFDYGNGSDALTATQLRRAGRDYPAWVEDRYLQGAGDDSISGKKTRATAERIRRSHTNPYDQAIEVQDLLRGMTYTTEGLAELCDGLTVPECVLEHGEGFCQYYASTMAMVLREMGIPSRLVRGFLPGQTSDGESWTVPNEAFHAWVEAFFPGHGWVRFDPTPPTRALEAVGQEATALIDREDETPQPERTPRPQPEPEPSDFPEPSPTLDPQPNPVDDACTNDCDDALAGLLVSGGIAGLMLVVIGGLLVLRLIRGPAADGSTAYGAIVRLATRLGHGPHPAQTEYEYAASLSTTLPRVRDDLYLVAATRVESTYGQRAPDDGRRTALRQAYRRIRTALLGLSFRRRRG